MRVSSVLRSSRVRQVMAVPLAACLFGGLALVTSAPSGASIAATAATRTLSASSSGCVKGTAQGVTSSTVTLAVTEVAISGGALTNATIGVPSTQVQENDWNTVAQSINKSGGAGCRKIQLKFFPVNPIDAAGAQQSCLTIAASKPFMVLDVGALSAVNASNCIPTAKVAYASQYLTPDQLSKYYPYYLSLIGLPVSDIRNSVLGFKQLGYFSSAKGFKKLGVLYDTCNSALIVAERAALKEAGVPKSKIVEFNLGCPAGQNFTQSILQPAVLAFKNAGVTDVTSAEAGTSAAIFTQVAGQQNYKPQYLLSSDTVALPNTTGSDVPDSTNLNGALNVTSAAYGEETVPGFKPGPGTQKCDALFRGPGNTTVYKSLDGYEGVACNYLWFVQNILNRATSLQPSQLPVALHAVGTVQYSYPSGPVNYTATLPKKAPYGVGYWRAETYVSSCKCWHIPDPTWNPPFK
jgi:hypothetical protein